MLPAFPSLWVEKRNVEKAHFQNVLFLAWCHVKSSNNCRGVYFLKKRQWVSSRGHPCISVVAPGRFNSPSSSLSGGSSPRLTVRFWVSPRDCYWIQLSTVPLQIMCYFVSTGSDINRSIKVSESAIYAHVSQHMAGHWWSLDRWGLLRGVHFQSLDSVMLFSRSFAVTQGNCPVSWSLRLCPTD